VLAQLQHHPLLQPEGDLDPAAYVQLARRVLAGDLALGPGLYYLSPLYIYFLAATLWVSDSFTWVRLVQIALGTASVACIFATARDWFGRRAAWVAAGLAAFTGVFTFYEILILQSSLDAFLTAAGLMFLTNALVDLPRSSHVPPSHVPPKGGSYKNGIWNPVVSAFRRKELLAGLFFGLQILNRPNVIVAVAGVALSLLLIRRARIAAVLAAGVLVAMAPVVLRNALVPRQFALVSSQGGLNLYIGNHEAATGQYTAVPGVRANIDGQAGDTRRVAEQSAGRPLTDAEVSAHFTGLATTWMRGHPAAAARLFVRKLALVFNARHQWLDFSYPYYARDTGSLLVLLFVGPWLLVPLGLVGLALGLRPPSPRGFGETGEIRDRAYLVWASFVPWYALGVALFFVAERYRLPIFVPLCVAAGGAVERISQLLVRAMSSGPFAVPAAAFIAGCVLTGWPFRLEDGRFEERLRLSKVLMNRGDYGTAVMELEKAHAIDPAHAITEFNLGMALTANGRTGEGISHIRRAVEEGVAIDGARYALASALLSSGDIPGAAALLRTFTPAASDGADSCYQVGVLALDAGAPEVAARFLSRALALRPGWPEAQRAIEESRRR
jgi:4-amino-4-deoxy-L-arabinose transferase-like glycosyltransferase